MRRFRGERRRPDDRQFQERLAESSMQYTRTTTREINIGARPHDKVDRESRSGPQFPNDVYEKQCRNMRPARGAAVVPERFLLARGCSVGEEVQAAQIAAGDLGRGS